MKYPQKPHEGTLVRRRACGVPRELIGRRSVCLYVCADRVYAVIQMILSFTEHSHRVDDMQLRVRTLVLLVFSVCASYVYAMIG